VTKGFLKKAANEQFLEIVTWLHHFKSITKVKSSDALPHVRIFCDL